MTFDEWLDEQPWDHSPEFEAMLREAWEAGRIQGWIQADRVQKLRFNEPIYRIPQDLEILANS